MRFTVYSFILLIAIALAVYFLVRRKWLPGALLAAAILAGFLFGGNVASHVTVEAGVSSVDASSFVRTGFANSATFVSDLSIVDLNAPGDYPVQIRVGRRTYHRVLRVEDTVSPAATVVAVSALPECMPPADAFIRDVIDVTPVTVTYSAEPNMLLEGEQAVVLLLTDAAGNTAKVQAILSVHPDRQAPSVSLSQPLQTYLGESPDYLQHLIYADNMDADPVLTVDSSAVDIHTAGTYYALYTCVDASGNQTVLMAPVSVIDDSTAPTIYGVRKITLYAGTTVSYRSGIVLEDNFDDNPVLTIDASDVNLSEPGKYVITYTATDAAGNEAQVSTDVVVKKAPKNYVQPDVINALADSILAQITTEDMTNQQKVEAIYQWFNDNCHYANLSYTYNDKTDWMQSAYHMLNKHYGNCFGYYAASKLFFERLGLPNTMVRRAYNAYRPYDHYWNLVSLDGGETWYHFDTTQSSSSAGHDRCLLTDAQLDYFSEKYARNYYFRDKSLTPATPEEPLVEFS